MSYLKSISHKFFKSLYTVISPQHLYLRLLILFLPFALSLALLASAAFAATVTIAWDKSPGSDIAGYKIHYGTSTGDYDYSVDVGNFTSCTISGLEEEQNYYFAATSYNTDNTESEFSEELVYTIPAEPAEKAKIWLEAEDGDLYTPMEENWNNEDASSGGYIWVPNGHGNLYNISDEAGFAEYTFDVPVAGTYMLWGRVISNSLAEDSFFVSIDGGNYIAWHTQLSGTETWIWDQVRDGTVNDGKVLYLDLQAGQHTLSIKQREDGTKIDRILITNDLEYTPEGLGEEAIPSSVKVWLEAEDGDLYTPMEENWNNEDASSGGYIWVPNGHGNLYNISDEAGFAEYTFDVPVAGTYMLWGRVISNSLAEDSFFVSIDGGNYIAWHTQLSGTETWIWDQVRDGTVNDGKVLYLDLQAGQHTLSIKQREDGTKIDRILITNDLEYTPEGLGEEAIPSSVKVWLEAEDGDLYTPMEENWNNEDASSGGYIWVPNGHGNLYNISSENGSAEYTFEVPVAGTYMLWGRVISNSLAEDSFFVSIDGVDYIAWHTQLSGTETWIWDQVRDGTVNDGKVLYLDLQAGKHTLTIKQREDGTKIDRILITNDLDYIPER